MNTIWIVLPILTLLMFGLVLIACCPGGSSSNVFSKLAGGDVALSVTLTALSSLITLLTIPIVMSWATRLVGESIGRPSSRTSASPPSSIP